MNLSEQQLIDCSQDYGCGGCNGCLPSKAFEYIKYNGGLDIEEFYPYLDPPRNGSSCKYNPLGVGVTLTGGSFNVTANDEEQLQDLVTYVGPVTISFCANNLHTYISGVYTGEFNGTACPSGHQEVNHAVLVVGTGYDSTSQMPYWIVKNSWGTDFGLDGYFWLLRGNNTCGVADCASYPLITGEIPYIPGN